MIKKRNWGAVIYPESVPDDWIETLKIKGISFAISPLHDKDIDPTGENKKPHYHIILCFSGPTTDKTVNDIVVKDLGQPIAIPLESVQGYYRYFTHQDNPDKYQYDKKEIRVFNGFDVTEVLNNFEVNKLIRQIISLIIEKGILNYCDLLELLYNSEEDFELFNVASSKTLLFNTYISSKRNKIKELTEKLNKPLEKRKK